MSEPKIDVEEMGLPTVIEKNERTVREGFWRKMQRYLARVPFAETAVAAYYCAFDPATPTKVKAYILGALAYFILPLDVIPDFILGVGFGDDLTVLLTIYGLVRSHITDEHRERARETLERLRRNEEPIDV